MTLPTNLTNFLFNEEKEAFRPKNSFAMKTCVFGSKSHFPLGAKQTNKTPLPNAWVGKAHGEIGLL